MYYNSHFGRNCLGGRKSRVNRVNLYRNQGTRNLSPQSKCLNCFLSPSRNKFLPKLIRIDIRARGMPWKVLFPFLTDTLPPAFCHSYISLDSPFQSANCRFTKLSLCQIIKLSPEKLRLPWWLTIKVIETRWDKNSLQIAFKKLIGAFLDQRNQSSKSKGMNSLEAMPRRRMLRTPQHVPSNLLLINT